MEQRFIMTAFGRDRVGIVADVTEIMYELGCNLEDATMTRLSDEFAIIFLFTSQDPELEPKLDTACRRLEHDKSVTAFFRPLGPEPLTPDLSLPRRTLHLEGVDQTGIVSRFSRFLANSRVNILFLQSERRFIPQSGTALYIVDMDVEIPYDLGLEAFQAELRRLGDELHVEAKLT